MKTSADAKDLNYRAEKRYGSLSNTIDTSSTLPDSFRTVDNTEVEVLDLVLDADGNLVDSPVINNSPKSGGPNSRLTTDINQMKESPNSYNSYNVGNKATTETLEGAKSSSSSATNAVENEILDMQTNNSTSSSSNKKDIGSIVGKNGQPMAQTSKKGAEEEMAIKTEKLGATPRTAAGANASAHPQINVNEIEFEGELMPTSSDESGDGSDGSDSGSDSETVSSSHRQTESLAYYSNDWISIFDTLAESGYNSVLDTNYFNMAYASTAAKLAKNAKYVR